MKKRLISASVMTLIFSVCIEGIGYTAEINPADYVQDTYGTEGGVKEKYFQFVKNESGDYILNELGTIENSDFKVIYSPANYEQATEPLNNNLTPENVKDKLFEGFSGEHVIHVESDFSDIDVVSDFVGNTYLGSNANGIIYIWRTSDKLNSVTGTFINNEVGRLGGGINVHGKLNTITGDYINNKAGERGGAICVWGGYAGTIIGNFIGNSVQQYGGAIANNTGGLSVKIDKIQGTFIDNHAGIYGGAIFSGGDTGEISNSNFIANYANSGGAIFNLSTIGIKDAEGNFTGGITNSNFYGNYAKSESGTAQGGAIYTNKNLNVIADNGTSTFKDNYVQIGEGEKDYQAIWVEGADKNLNLQQFNNGKMYMYDNINGTDGYTVNIQGDGTGTLYMLNDIKNANVTFDNTTVNTINDDVHVYDFNSFTVNGDTNFVADVDLANEQMDRITANSYGTHAGNLNVIGMNLLNDAIKDNTKILFAEEGLASNVTSSVTQIGKDVENTFQTTTYAPIYKYNVSYKVDSEDNQGYFMFARSGGDNPTPSDFNPAVLASPVATQAGVQATLNTTFNYAFNNADMFTKLPHNERMARINANRYASLPRKEENKGFASTDFNQNLNLGSQYEDNSAVWVRPYAVFESIPLNNGPRVDAVSYGTLVGFDTDFHHHKNGWNSVFTGYVGYNGAQLNYGGGDTSLNGGLLGVTETFYKNNFWTAITATTGASVAETNTMYGKDHSTSLLAGIGSKTGYNFEFKQGKFIIQPIWFMNYSFVNTFDYTNAAGVRIDSKPLNTIQLNPSIRFIGNIKGWQPYASVGMVWNLMNRTDVSANGVQLPDMHIDPYFQYGVGIQKTVNDRFTGFLQAMMHNGGRNGISLTGGFRWAIGNDNKVKTNKKVDKSEIIHSAQNDRSTNSKTLLK